MYRLLVTDPTADLEPWIIAVARALSATVTRVGDGTSLETALHGPIDFDLVVTAAQLEGPSGLQVLARARSRKVWIPFIVVTSLHGHLARVMVSNAATQTLTSRMLDADNLAQLARDLVKDARRADRVCVAE